MATASASGELQPGDQVVVDGIDRLREGAKVTVIEADKVQKVDQAVQDAASQPRGMRNLPPEVRAKLATMNPDERKAYLQNCAPSAQASATAVRRVARAGARRPAACRPVARAVAGVTPAFARPHGIPGPGRPGRALSARPGS